MLPQLLRIAVPLAVFAAFYCFATWIQVRAERRAEQGADDAERPAEQPPTEPPEDTLLAA